MKEHSNGATASYYELPAGAAQLQDLISQRDMNAQIGEIFRACYRYGLVSHSDKLRDARKILFYAQAEVERLEKLAVSSAADVEPTAENPWYPDDSGEWVEVPDDLMERPAALAEDTRIEVLFRGEREDREWESCEGSAGDLKWSLPRNQISRIVSYRVIEEAQQ